MKKSHNKIIIVAEITTNHLGDINRLLKMTRLAKEAGADLVKIQRRDIEPFYPPGQLDAKYSSPFGPTYRDFRNGLELSIKEIGKFDNACKKIGIGWFASILDFDSFLSINKFKTPLHKIPSTVSKHKQFHKLVADLYKGPIVVSTGFTTPDYEKYVQQVFKNNDKIYLLQCTSSYPTSPENCDISVIRHYNDLSKKNTKLIPGYSSHDGGSLGCMLAVAAGARMIEKHVKLGNTSWMHFQDIAVDLANGDFKRFVKDVRRAEIMCGDDKKSIKARENHKYNYIPKINHEK